MGCSEPSDVRVDVRFVKPKGKLKLRADGRLAGSTGEADASVRSWWSFFWGQSVLLYTVPNFVAPNGAPKLDVALNFRGISISMFLRSPNSQASSSASA